MEPGLFIKKERSNRSRSRGTIENSFDVQRNTKEDNFYSPEVKRPSSAAIL